MRKSMVFKLAATSTALALTAIGCSPRTGLRPAKLSGVTPKQAQGAARAASQALIALRNRQLPEAVSQAETAVMLSPSDAGYRALLAQAYLESGRFVSAEAAFGDVVALDRSNGKAMLGRGLAQIAQGRHLAALGTLEGAEGLAAPGDLGLAFALAGDPKRAISLLEPAARHPSATPKVRQNLALAYALAGDWAKAKATAAVDLSPDQLPARLESWARLASPAQASEQVASLLGVTPVADPGQPERLALANTGGSTQTVAIEAPLRLAEAAPAPVVAPAPAPVPAPTVQTPDSIVRVPVAPAPVSLAEAVPPAPVETVAEAAPVRPIPYRMPTERPASPLLKPAPKRVAAADPARVAPFVARPAALQQSGGRYVVQLGAFSDPRRVEAAWDSVSTRMARLSGFTPSRGVFKASADATFHRLSIAGIATREDAVKLCGSIRAAGGACFVRETFNDAPIQWVKRDAPKAPQEARRATPKRDQIAMANVPGRPRTASR